MRVCFHSTSAAQIHFLCVCPTTTFFFFCSSTDRWPRLLLSTWYTELPLGSLQPLCHSFILLWILEMHKPMHLSSCGWRCCTTTVTHAQTVSPHMAFKPDVPSSWLTFVTVYFSAALSQHHLLLSHLLLPLLPVWPPRSCQLLLQQPAGFQLQVRTKTYPESSGLSVILQSEKQIFFFFYRTDENNSSTNQESALSPQGGASGEARRYQKKKHVTQVF